MAKTINIKDIKILDITFSKVGSEYVFSVAYSLLDVGDQEWSPKRVTLKSFTTGQKQKIAVLEAVIRTILKQQEGL